MRLDGPILAGVSSTSSTSPMPQTLLALLALSLSSLLVFNQQRLQMRAQSQMVSNELSLAGSGLASDIMEMIGARSFDEASTPDKIDDAVKVPDDPSAFTQPWVLKLAALKDNKCDLLNPDDVCDDIDDVNGLSHETYSIMLAEGRELDFDVSTSVIYVTDPEGGVESSVPTRHKKVTLEVRSLNGSSTAPPLTFARVFSYDPIKAEMDYERIYGPIGTDGDDSGGGGAHTQN